jgi:hypothetical protein
LDCSRVVRIRVSICARNSAGFSPALAELTIAAAPADVTSRITATHT